MHDCLNGTARSALTLALCFCGLTLSASPDDEALAYLHTASSFDEVEGKVDYSLHTDIETVDTAEDGLLGHAWIRAWGFDDEDLSRLFIHLHVVSDTIYLIMRVTAGGEILYIPSRWDKPRRMKHVGDTVYISHQIWAKVPAKLYEKWSQRTEAVQIRVSGSGTYQDIHLNPLALKGFLHKVSDLRNHTPNPSIPDDLNISVELGV